MRLESSVRILIDDTLVHGPSFRLYVESDAHRRNQPPILAVNRSRSVMGLLNKQPVLGNDVFVAPNAVVAGDVHLGSQSSVYYGAVLRGRSHSFFRFDIFHKPQRFTMHLSSSQATVERLALESRPTFRMALSLARELPPSAVTTRTPRLALGSPLATKLLSKDAQLKMKL